MRKAAAAAVLFGLAAVPSAHAAKFTIKGAGFGHGVGMSQYGAYGYALKGFTYDAILGHYYTGTGLGDAGGEPVRVLLQSGGTSSVSNAVSVNGKRLKPGSTYSVRRVGDGAVLTDARGRNVKAGTLLRVKGKGSTLTLGGVGRYRGQLEFRRSGASGVQAVNAVSMENYVRGVISRESPASWPAEALKAQAVAARTYALTTSKGGFGFDQYADTRSQVYGGIAAETPTTDAATADTAGEVVTYNGKPVTTYFFSTSGGRTENVENTTLGTEPLPWLKSVNDPYDDESPKHRWTVRTTTESAGAKLGGLVKGSFKGIEVTQRGVSPRIVSADIVGTGGRTEVDGATIRARLGLFDTWASFTSLSTKATPSPDERDRSGGASPLGLASSTAWGLRGTALGHGRTVVVERRVDDRWQRAGTTRTDRRGRYAFPAAGGVYRVVYGAATGRVVRLHA